MHSYLKYWNLSAPITSRQGEQAIFTCERPKQNLTKMLQMITTDNVLVTIPASSGLGKTSLLEWLKSNLPFPEHEVFAGTLIRQETEEGWLSEKLLQHLRGDTHDNQTPVKDQLKQALKLMDEFKLQQTRLVCLIDNAHKIKGSGFNEINALFDLADIVKMPFSCVMAGEPALTDNLLRTSQLQHRIRMQLPLLPFSTDESLDYLNYLVEGAGLHQTFIAKDAQLKIARAAAGIPSRLNNLLENAVLEAAQTGAKLISMEHVVAAEKLLAPLAATIQDSTYQVTTRADSNMPKDKSGEKKLVPKHSPGSESSREFPSADAQDMDRETDAKKPSRISIGSLLKDV